MNYISQIIHAAKFDREDQDRATQGLCGTFAITLYKMMAGGKLVLIVRDNNGEPERMYNGTYAWHHCAVRYDDRYFDVLGESEPSDLIEGYICKSGRGHIVEVDEKEFWRNIRAVPCAYSGYWRAKWKQKLLHVTTPVAGVC